MAAEPPVTIKIMYRNIRTVGMSTHSAFLFARLKDQRGLATTTKMRMKAVMETVATMSTLAAG